MKFEVKHIYDSTVADKNAIVANALQFNIVAGSDIETTPSTANTYEFYYKYKGTEEPVLFLTTNQLSTNYYFKKDQWENENALTLESGNRYFDCDKLTVKVFLPATQEPLILSTEREETQEENLPLRPEQAKLVAWVSPLVLVQKEGDFERPANVTELAQNYALKLTATNLSISSTNQEFSQWSPKLIDYHYWLNQATDQYIDIPIAPLAFPLEIGHINEQNILYDFSFNFTLTLGKKDQTDQIILLDLKDKHLIVNQGYLFLQPEIADNNTYRITQTSANNGETLIASHIQIQEAKFSELMSGLSAGREDLFDYHIYLTIKDYQENSKVAGVQDFQYLTTLNLIFREKPFFKGNFQAEDLTWTLDKNDLTNYPWHDLMTPQQIADGYFYNAGASFKFNFDNAMPQLCGRDLSKYVLYESDDQGIHYYRLLELDPSKDNSNETIYTVIRRSASANIRYGIGIITKDEKGYLETPFNNILKINLTLPIGRISTPIALIDNCVADEVVLDLKEPQSKTVVLKPQLKIVDYGGNNQKDFNISKLPSLANQFGQTVNLSCTIKFEYSQNKKFLSSQTTTVERIITLTEGQSYQSVNWSNLFDQGGLPLADKFDLSATLYLRATLSFVYGCQDNIDLLMCETPIYTYFGLKQLPTVSYLKNQIGINTPNLANNEVIGITSTTDKALIRLLNGSEHYSSVNINTRNLQEFIIDCGNWDDAEFGYTNFQIISNPQQNLDTSDPWHDLDYEEVVIPDINDATALEAFEALWKSIDFYNLVKEYNVSGGFTGRKNYYKINSKNSDWKEVCKELTTIYKIKTNLSYEWLYDISHSKFTVVQEIAQEKKEE